MTSRRLSLFLLCASLLPAQRIHMIGQAHIDPVWLWPWAEGLSVVHSTFRSALDRMNETPDFTFTASSAQFYEWVAENDPAMLAEIRKRVEEGRWGLVGGWWVEPDVNLPGGESLARQGLYGQAVYRRLFGRTARVGFNPDSFGHPATLPQILKLQGIEDYVFMRPMPREKTLPADVFWWQGPDGSRVLTYRIPFSYNDEGSVRDRVRRTLELKEPVRSMMAFYGAGDHGGGATKENIRSIQEMQAQAGGPTLLYSTPDRYFAEVRKSASELPELRGDLQHHSVGCYTAESQIKKLNRTAEMALVTAEKIAAVGSAAWGAAYPKEAFTSAWKRVLFLQFHDSLAGTSLPEHYATAVPRGYGYAMDVADQAVTLAAQKLAWEVPAADPDSKYLLVFNPHAWETTATVEYDIGYPVDAGLLVEDGDGKPVEFQTTPPSAEVNGRQRIVLRLKLPAFGYRQVRIRRGKGQSAGGGPAGSPHLENEYLRASFGEDGAISLFDKDSGEAVFTGAHAAVFNDPSDTWSHDVRAYDELIGAFGAPRLTQVEDGPLRQRVSVRATYGASTLTTDWLLYAGARSVEVRVTLDWREHRKMLKFLFPVNVRDPKPTYEVPYGHLEREANGDEDPGQRWVDLSGGGRGLTVINDAKYGYSAAGADLRISVVRGAPYAHHIPHVVAPDHDVLWQDQGLQTFRMLVAPHRGGWQEAPRMADEFTAPVPVIYQGIHGGNRPQADSFLSVDVPNVVVSAIKQAEAGDDLIFRLYETGGRATNASLDLRFAKRGWSGSFRPSEIKTLRLNRGTGQIREVNLLEEAQ
ncbi:MAG: alpha-mannosidase [Acidobacteriia bacterium]|nr:alpha-mannosidase [Terriglobia bacterium]